MIVRIVKMTFKKDKVEEFEFIFNESKTNIRNFEGCTYLSLHVDYQQSNIYYTISHWKDQNHLDRYRASTLFKETWAKTKILFKEKPEAYSLLKKDQLP